MCMYARERNTTRNRAAGDFSQHLNSHSRLNLILLVYSLIMLVKTIEARENINLVLASVLCLLEILYRTFTFYAMNNEADYIVPVEATDDSISPVNESKVFGNKPCIHDDPVLKPFVAFGGDELPPSISSQHTIVAPQEEIQQEGKSQLVI